MSKPPLDLMRAMIRDTSVFMNKTFDPNAAATRNSGVFGLPLGQDASVIYLPVPWEVTTSYGGGTSKGPQAIFQASRQVDLYDYEVLRPYEAGIYMKEASKQLVEWNEIAKSLAQKDLKRVNEFCSQMNSYVATETAAIFKKACIPVIVGGDHSVALGAFQAASQAYSSFGILHFDAHLDMRKAFEGFTYSHASIMYNALETIPQIQKLVSVSIRDFCEEEMDYCESQGERVHVFYDRALSDQKFSGKSWNEICEGIIKGLPQNVWISFDIDGLDQALCPNTGTPVPGGLSFQEACAILSTLAKSRRKIIGFDLTEIAPGPDEWDANVGARLLYKITALALATQGRAKFRI